MNFDYASPDGIFASYEEDEEWLEQLYQREEDIATQEDIQD